MVNEFLCAGGIRKFAVADAYRNIEIHITQFMLQESVTECLDDSQCNLHRGIDARMWHQQAELIPTVASSNIDGTTVVPDDFSHHSKQIIASLVPSAGTRSVGSDGTLAATAAKIPNQGWNSVNMAM